jgi:hypothetical protein
MKTSPRFYAGNIEPPVKAYQREDVIELQPVFGAAEQLWFDSWQEQGRKDEGSCCGGKGIQVWFLGPRKRAAQPRTIIRCDWVQGNLSAQASVEAALAYLKEQGIEAEYYDGWMS